MLSDTLTSCKTPTTNTPSTIYTPGTFTIAPLDLLDDTRLSPAARLLWLILQSYIYNQSAAYCWPSKATLAARLGVSERRVYDLLRELEAHEAITITTRTGEGRTNVYHLHPRPARGGDAENFHPPMQKTSTEVYQGKEDQEEEKDTQKGANAPVCEETHPIEPSVIAIPESSAQARYDHDTFEMGYVARPPRQTRGRSAHHRTQHTQPNAGQTAPESAGHASRSQTSQHTHAPLGAPPAPAQTVQDAIQTEIARQLTAYGVWPRRAGVLAAQARSAGRSPDDIQAMYDYSQTAHDPAALLAAMIANNATPPPRRVSHDSTITAESAAKYTTGKYASIFNRPPAHEGEQV